MLTSVFLGVAACGQLMRVSRVSGASSVLAPSYRQSGVSDGIKIFSIVFYNAKERGRLGSKGLESWRAEEQLRNSMTKGQIFV